MKIYISGPITGRNELNRAAFSSAAEALREHGYDVLNPHEMVDPSSTWRQAMRICIAELAANADAVLMLAGWMESRGATIERELADNLGIRVFYSMEDICLNLGK